MTDDKQPFTCPVCCGHGTVQKPPWVAGDQQTWSSGHTGWYTCPACTGEGIVWNEEER